MDTIADMKRTGDIDVNVILRHMLRLHRQRVVSQSETADDIGVSRQAYGQFLKKGSGISKDKIQGLVKYAEQIGHPVMGTPGIPQEKLDASLHFTRARDLVDDAQRFMTQAGYSVEARLDLTLSTLKTAVNLIEQCRDEL